MAIFDNDKMVAVNWDHIEDAVDEATWRKLTEQFWLDSRVPVANDMKDWRNLTEVEKDVMNKAFAGLTLLDTLQSEDGNRQIFRDARNQKEEAVLGNIQFMECMTADSKLVTPKGLVSVKDIKKGDLVLQYNPENKSSEFAKVVETSHHLPEKVYNISSAKFDLKVSPGHRMLLEEKTIKESSKKEWENKVVEAKDYNNIPKTANYRNRLMSEHFISDNDSHITNIEKFLIALQADGSVPQTRINNDKTNRVTIIFNIKKEHKLEYLRSIIKKLPNTFEITDNSGKDYKDRESIYVTIDKDLAKKLGITHEKDFDKMFNLSNFSEKKSQEFITELSHWDSYTDETSIAYSSKNKNNIDFVSAVTILASKGFHIYEYDRVKYGKEYILRIGSQQEMYTSSMLSNIKITENEAEEVYGIEVPSTFLVVMTSKGPIITGNCVHAKSYSTIFSTFNTPLQIDDIFEWIKDNKHLQYKAKKIHEVYMNGTGLQKKAASVLLESFLFYSGFYTPLHFLGESRMVNTAEIIKLILRDESVHGTYLGYKFSLGYNELSENEQEELKNWVYDFAYSLYENELEYIKELYSEIGWVEPVRIFTEYNLNKALANLKFPQMFPTSASDVDPLVMNGISTETSNHDFFSQVGNGYLLGKVEEVDEDDFDSLDDI